MTGLLRLPLFGLVAGVSSCGVFAVCFSTLLYVYVVLLATSARLNFVDLAATKQAHKTHCFWHYKEYKKNIEEI